MYVFGCSIWAHTAQGERDAMKQHTTNHKRHILKYLMAKPPSREFSMIGLLNPLLTPLVADLEVNKVLVIKHLKPLTSLTPIEQ